MIMIRSKIHDWSYKIMAKKANYSADVIQHEKHKKVTSIGRAARCTPKNKNKRANWKRYRGQGS